MRLLGTVHVSIAGSLVEREPTRWEKLKRSLGASLDLSTNQMKVELEATAVIDGVKRAISRLGVNNAITLVIDETVIFQDTQGNADDLGDLTVAMAEHASVFGRGFKELRFAAEHVEGNLHLVIETRARTIHKAEEPAAIISVGGRLKALEPRPGESPDDYRARIEPLTKDTVAFETARLQFQTFVTRLEEALSTTMPQARVEEVKAEARLVKASPRDLTKRPDTVRDPAHPAYDPFLMYYPSPMGTLLDVMLISSFMHALHPPHMFITNPAGHSLGSVQDVKDEPERLADDHEPDRGGSDEADSGDEGGYQESADEGGDDGGGGFDDGGGFDSFD